MNRSSNQMDSDREVILCSGDIGSNNADTIVFENLQENSAESFSNKPRRETSSPYDNLFLDPQTPKHEPKRSYMNGNDSVLVENRKNFTHCTSAFIKYGPNNLLERSQNTALNDDEYTSDDSVYQSEENQSISSACSSSPTHQIKVNHSIGSHNGNKRKQKKSKSIRDNQSTKTNDKPRIEMAVRRSTASIMESRLTSSSQTSKHKGNICPIHDESDFIGKW